MVHKEPGKSVIRRQVRHVQDPGSYSAVDSARLDVARAVT